MGILTATEWLIIVAALLGIKVASDVYRLWRDRSER